MTAEARRVVTGWSEAGEPVVLFDGPRTTTVDVGSTQASELWVTGRSPANVRVRDDAAVGEWNLDPPAGGSAFRLVTYQPGAEVDIHTTATLDYIIVLSGRLTLILPDTEITLEPGDSVVQQATPHGWANRTLKPCVMAAVLLSCHEGGDA